MRVTNNMISYNFLSSLNKSLERQNNIQEQLADGKSIHKPSDDPIRAVRSLKFSSSLTQNDQFSQNLRDAISWMTSTDDAMSDLSSIMINIKEKVSQAATGTTPQDAVQTIGTAVDNLINQIVTIGNTKIGDRYIFAGQQDKTTPFVRNGDQITYNGDNNKVSMPIQPGVTNPNQDGVNLTGEDVFGDNISILNHLIEIKQHLQSGTPTDQEWLSTTGLDYLDTDHSNMLQAQTQLGTRMSAYEMAQNMLDNNNTTIQQDIAGNEDVDMAKAIIDYKNSQNVYQAALSVGAKILPTSLVDFLK